MSETSKPSLLTPGQRRIVGLSITITAVLVTAAALIFALTMLGQVVGFFSSVLWPLAVAGVLALILRPVVDLMETKMKLKRSVSVTLLYGVVVLVVGGTLFLLLPPLIDQALTAVFYAPSLWSNAVHYVEQHYPHWVDLARRQLSNPSVHAMVQKLAGEAQGALSHAIPSVRAAGGTLIGAFAFVTHVAIIPVYLFFFLLSTSDPRRKLRDQLSFLSEPVRDDIVFLATEFVSIVESFFRGQLIIGLIMGALLAVGFSVVGLKFGLFIGLALGVLNIVPYLGTIIGLGVSLPLALLQPDGGWQLVGYVLLVKLIVQCIESWLLTPRIMGERTGLHPVAIIVAIFFWGTALGGILGMLLAIPLTAFFVTAWRYVRREYLKD